MKELELIDDYINNALTKLLIKMIPEYKVYYESYNLTSELMDEGIYLFMNRFATYLSGEIKKDISSIFVKNSFAYINTLGMRSNLEIRNIVRIGILEILYTEKGVERDKIRESLSDELKGDFDNFSKLYF